MFNVLVFAQPIANFTANITNGCAPLVVQFQDISTGNPTQWRWDLGNGTLSTQQNPIGTYFIPGSYTVRLIAQNASGIDTLVKIAYIIVNSSPTVNFSASAISGCYPLKVSFTDLSIANSGTVTEWTWDFGDGSISNQQNPLHTYVVAGSFTVTLKVKNSAGCVTILNRANYINIPSGVLSNFSFIASNGCSLPSNVSFNNTSTGTGSFTFLWNFGDGGTSTQPNPIHAYTAQGTYSVTLITTNNNGCRDTLFKPNLINIGSVTANYSVNGSCVGSPITFTNTSTPTPISSFWNFGDATTATSLNAIKQFATAGTYPVKLVVDFGLCKDSTTKIITINPKPIASFTNNPIGACAPPLNVQFNNFSTAANSYNWLFGDGGISTQTSPSNSYTTSGGFNVSLIATNNFGCRDTLVKQNAVVIQPPQITSLVGVPYSGCSPYTANFSAIVNSIENIVKYEWNFGDGTPLQLGSNPSHTYTLPGTYTITLTVTTANGCSATRAFPSAIILNTRPIPSFSATPLNACAEEIINFTDNSSGTITSWFWQFGDGGTSNAQNPLYNYTDTGFFNVTLITFNGSCRDSTRINRYIYIKPPIARFNKTFNCDTPMQRRFFDLSILPQTYLWSFGDGNTSTLPNPVHTYVNGGIYAVRLTVTNGGCTHFMNDTVIVVSPNPSFTINGTSFCKYANAVFTITNIDTTHIANYNWNFGDGVIQSGSRLSSIAHQYLSSGNVNPSLSITDVLGCTKSITQPVTISIYGPKAGFTNPPGTCINSTINFTDTSTTDGIHTIQKWIWVYGDGSRDTLTSPPFSHQYTTTGSFDVLLKIVDAFGCYDTLFKPAAVLITKPVANFFSIDTIRCQNNNVTFVNQSVGVNLQFTWNFGDLNSSTAFNPQHSYSSVGQYSVGLKVIDIFGCTDSILKPLFIRVANPKANFSFLVGDTLGLCYPFLIEVAHQSLNTKSVIWSFGDGGFSNLDTPSHFYNNVGTYPLVLRATGYGNCVDSTRKNIVVRGPTGTFTYGPTKFCKPDTVTFVANSLNNATFFWDFSDGVTIATFDSVIKHSYSASGLFRPKMILIDAAGCQVPIQGADTIKVLDITTKIKVPQTQFCDSVRLNFLDSTVTVNDVVTNYLWNFGNNVTSTQINPQYLYQQPGNYTVSLKVTSAFGCTYTDTLRVPIKIAVTPLIDIAGNNEGCVNTLLSYQGIVVSSDTAAIKWSWNFDNGFFDTLQIPKPQFYTVAGNYTITAISSIAAGCSDTAFKNIIIHPAPITNAGIDSVVCKGSSITLQPSGATNYVWSADSTLSCLNCTNPNATPDSLKMYRVTGSNSFGCSSVDSVYINVIQPFTLKVPNTDTICIGESVQPIASGADNYAWSPNNTTINNATIFNPILTPTSTTNYIVTGTDRKNCFTRTANFNVVVYPIPQINIVQQLIKENVGVLVPLVTTNSLDITNWRWIPNKWLTCYNCPNPQAIVTDNIKYIVEASNLGGCTSKDEVTIEALCNGFNIFIPNTFSPNGDAINDVFYPRGKGLFKIRTMKIFNRWGEIVFAKSEFAANDESFGWDGTYNGKLLRDDVYVYIIEVICNNNQVIPLKGNITLFR